MKLNRKRSKKENNKFVNHDKAVKIRNEKKVVMTGLAYLARPLTA